MISEIWSLGSEFVAKSFKQALHGAPGSDKSDGVTVKFGFFQGAIARRYHQEMAAQVEGIITSPPCTIHLFEGSVA